MKISVVSTLRPLLLVCAIAMPVIGMAQTPVEPNADHESMLASGDPRAQVNKRLVYDFMREVWEAGHAELASKYLAESYIQHNPNAPNGRAGFVGFLTKMKKQAPIEPKMKSPLVSITGDGDLVTIAVVRQMPDPKDASKNYTTTWFDMFRVQNGVITEHWDSALKPTAQP